MNTAFIVHCGNWIFPARDSTSGVQYPIDEALVVEIYAQTSKKEKQVSGSRLIQDHLTGPRILDVTVNDAGDVLRVCSLKNTDEELLNKRIAFSVKFNHRKLARRESLYISEKPGENLVRCASISEKNWNAIFFTSVLLQAHLSGAKFPSGIVFRKATTPEIEALGRW